MELTQDWLGTNYKNICILTLPDGLEVVRENAFQDYLMRTVVFPNSVKIIQKMAFANCGQLTKIVFYKDSLLETVESRAFCGTALKDVAFPPGANVAADAF